MRILIALATHNRPTITELCLKNLQSIKDEYAKLVVYDDASTAYDRAYLCQYADEVIRFDRQGGIERSRAKSFRDFIYRYTEFDLLYLTDNDTIHDPAFTSVLRGIFSTHSNNLPAGLFNSIAHRPPSITGNDGFYESRSCPGVSMCFTREMAAEIVEFLNHDPVAESTYGWDYSWPSILKKPFILPKISYVEHFARDRHEAGMHSQNSGLDIEIASKDFDNDRAINPSEFLVKLRPKVIKEILGISNESN